MEKHLASHHPGDDRLAGLARQINEVAQEAGERVFNCEFICRSYAAVRKNVYLCAVLTEKSMKKVIFSSAVVFLLSLALTSCATGKRAAINDLRNLTEHVVEDGYTYSFEDWKKAGEKYVKIQKKLSRYELTAYESKEVGDLTGQCLKGFASGSIANISGTVGGKIISAGSFLKGLLDGVGIKLF